MSPKFTKKELQELLKKREEEIKSLKLEIEKIKKEKEEYLDTLKRVAADFDNYRKRVEKREEEIRKFAGENLIKDIIPIVDDFERALNHLPRSSSQDFFQGLELVYKKFQEFLKSHAVERIESKGKEFDPFLHEAVEVVGEKGEKTVVIEELQPGYLMHGKLLRPAKVKVGIINEKKGG